MQFVTLEVIRIVHKSIVPASQKTQGGYITKNDRLTTYRNIITVYFENHRKHINVLCGGGGGFFLICKFTFKH